MTINEFLNQDIEDFDSISNYYVNYLKELSDNDYSFINYINLNGFSNKFMKSVERNRYLTTEEKLEYSEKVDNLLKNINLYHKSKKITNLFSIIIPFENKLFTVNKSFEQLYTSSLNFINIVIEYKGYKNNNLSINDFFEPKNTNKDKIKELINDAIELIREDDSLTQSTKEQLIDYLENVLKNLEKENVNWTEILGKIKETIIVLGALGSFIGGISPLMKAKEKLEETDKVIQKTSINYNYKTINNTFQINNIEQFNQIENDSILHIENQTKK
ncbi:hypothetical protein [Empedobacter falsenii]|uniref:hypothetical protein n=1 Tax=Empedobacter falsenii TaxID=343874 RepID=UPI001C8DC0A7|nr:hypothetical protein [Empedobacter falsenii]MBY0067835.1 hypothetical protein [Empedobacter falsenii]